MLDAYGTLPNVTSAKQYGDICANHQKQFASEFKFLHGVSLFSFQSEVATERTREYDICYFSYYANCNTEIKRIIKQPIYMG